MPLLIVKLVLFYLGLLILYSSFKDDIRGADPTDITILNAFQKGLDGSNHKPNKIQLDKGSEFGNRSVESWLQ